MKMQQSTIVTEVGASKMALQTAKKNNFVIWSKTFELDEIAIALYLVEIDQWLRRVSGRCILLRPSNAPILN